MPGPYRQSRNPYGNHTRTKHRPDKQTGGAKRGQGSISNEERERERVAAAAKRTQQEQARAKRQARDQRRNEARLQQIDREYEENSKKARRILESLGGDITENEDGDLDNDVDGDDVGEVDESLD